MCTSATAPSATERAATARVRSRRGRSRSRATSGSGVYKFRSTPIGTLPTTADLDRTIRDGLYGTLMPPFDALNRRARQDVIAYLETFSPRWRKEQPGTPVIVTEEPTPTTESVTRGRELFATNCASCHGDGTGNGLAATGMVDAWGIPFRRRISRSDGPSRRARRATFTCALRRGSMGHRCLASLARSRPDEIWAVAHYVQALGPWKGSTPELRAIVAQLPPASSVPATDSSAHAAAPDRPRT